MGQRKTTREIRKCFEMNEKRNTTYQNVWDAPKAILRGIFIAVGAHIRKEERFQIQ